MEGEEGLHKTGREGEGFHGNGRGVAVWKGEGSGCREGGGEWLNGREEREGCMKRGREVRKLKG